MARTTPSAADRALIEAVRRHGGTITATQLERCRSRAWLRSTREWYDEDSSTICPDVVQRAVQLAALARSGRSISWVGWVFWAIDDTPQTAKRLRAALLKTLRRPLTRGRVEQVSEGDSNEAFQARQEAAARMLHGRRSPRRDFDGTLRAHAAQAGVQLPRSPAHPVPNIFHPALMQPGARLLLGGAADVGFEELMEAWERAWPENGETIEQVRMMHREAELAGDDLMAQSPMADGLPGLIRAVETADDRPLCAAVRVCTKASGSLWMLWQRAVNEPEVLSQLMSDVMWDQWARAGGLAPQGVVGEAAVAMSTVQYLLTPDWAKDLDRYLTLMTTLLHPARSADPAPQD